MIEVEVLGADAAAPASELEHLCALAAGRLGVDHGHVAVEFVDAERIAELNLAHRAKAEPTDVLSFPIDGAGAQPASEGSGPSSSEVPRELGDIVICGELTIDIREAVVHGMLHLLGMDHESDHGEMLELQDELLARGRG